MTNDEWDYEAGVSPWRARPVSYSSFVIRHSSRCLIDQARGARHAFDVEEVEEVGPGPEGQLGVDVVLDGDEDGAIDDRRREVADPGFAHAGQPADGRMDHPGKEVHRLP